MATYLYIVLLWAVVPLAFAVAWLLARLLGRRLSSPEPRRAIDSDPLSAPEQCAACGSWQARHLTRAECWRCHATLERQARAEPTGDR